MPDRLNLRSAKVFLREVQPFLQSDRPQVVFDLSQVRQLDAAGVDMLLECMAQVMKRDGDLKLASLSPQAATILELTRTDRLFEIYHTSTDAVRSFTHFLPNAMRPATTLTFPSATAATPPDTTASEGGSIAA